MGGVCFLEHRRAQGTNSRFGKRHPNDALIVLPQNWPMDNLQTPLQMPLIVSRVSPVSLQDQIYSQIKQNITTQCLQRGVRLPSIRELSQQLHVSLNTVKLAYEQLLSEGYLVTSRGRGTFVTRSLPDDCLFSGENSVNGMDSERHASRFPPQFIGCSQTVSREMRFPPSIDFWVGRPDPDSFPLKIWQQLMVKNLQHAQTNLTDYGNPAGLEKLRQAIVDHLAQARGFRPDPCQVIVTAGIQEALNLASRLFISPGGTVATESPCYKGASYVFESYGARIIPTPVDEEGICVDSLPAERTGLLYITPSHQYPLGYILSMERRHKLLDWAAESGAYILEDDYDSDFRFERSPLPALRALDKRGSVIYLGTFSKSMGAGLRLGYMIVPKELIKPTITAKALFDNGNAWPVQATMADYMLSGGFTQHLRMIRQRCQLRRDHLLQELKRRFGDVKVSGLSSGMHIVWHLPASLPDAETIQRLAAEHDVGVYCPEGGAASVEGFPELNKRLLLFGYSSLSTTEITEGVARLSEALSERQSN